MFTGIIEEIGTIAIIRKGPRSIRLHISARTILDDLKAGDSVAVNGVCLTADACYHGGFIADVMPETMQRTAFSAFAPGTLVNLERAMPADGRFGGHIVSGHIDGIGTIRSRTKDDNAVWLEIAAPAALLEQLVDKGSVTIDGVSLTVVEVQADSFTLSLIPHTAGRTTLLSRQNGDAVNIECDVLGKYIRKFLTAAPPKPEAGSLTMKFLHENGF